MVLFIDNYDSFTYNLVHYVETLGREVLVVRNDCMGAEDLFKLGATAVIVSPGPSSPRNAGVCVEFIQKFADRIPIFGVCLGMQSIACAFGGKIVRAKSILHGKTCPITHDGRGVFRGMANPMVAVRYHSLAVEEATLPPCFEVSAHSPDGEIMALRHLEFPIEGVQFHPESISTVGGKRILANFLDGVNAK